MKKAILGMVVFLCIGGVYGQDFDMDTIIIAQEMALMKMQGLIPMRFVNALDGKGIPNARIEIPGIGNFVTDSRGIITFPERPDGRFTMVFSKAGFITTAIDFPIQLKTVIFNWYSISPLMQADFRMVLDWGERPADLDLHFEKEGGYHISWRNMRAAADGTAKLDWDSRNGYGPETITVDRAESNHTYNLYVINYSHLGSRNSRSLGESGAVIRIYSNNRLLNTFTVPAGEGTRWNVCKIERGMVVPLGVLTN